MLNTLKRPVTRLRKLSLFEILIVLAGLTVVISVFFLLFRSKKTIIVVLKVYEDSVDMPFTRSSLWFSRMFYQGMKEKSAFGQVTAEVLKVRKYDDRPDNPIVYITVKLEAIYSRGTNVYTYKGKNILIGSTIRLFLDNTLVEGVVVDTKGVNNRYPLKKLIMTVELTNPETVGVMPYVAQAIIEGDEIRDSAGKVILKVLKKEVQDAQKLVNTDSGEIVLSRDPFRKDVRLTLEVQAYKIGDRYFFFDDKPLLVNKELPINFEKLSILPMITNIEVVR